MDAPRHFILALTGFFMMVCLAVPVTAGAVEVQEEQTLFSLGVSEASAMIEARRPEVSDPRHLPRLWEHGHRTQYSVLVIHGLFESPNYMKGISETFYKDGMNVISILLPGHWTKPLEKLDDVRYEDWIKECDRGMEIAHHLGRQVLIAGYSTGGVLAVERAIFQGDVVGVFAWAPALEVSARTAIGATLGSIFGISGNDFFDHPADGKEISYSSPHAGNEVRQLGELLGTLDPNHPISLFDPKRSESDSYFRRHDRYKKFDLPLFEVTTDLDRVVSTSEANTFFRLAHSPNKMLIRYTEKDGIIHDTIHRSLEDVHLDHPGMFNPYFVRQMKLMTDFIDRVFPDHDAP